MQIYLEKKIIGKQCPLNINRSAQPIDDGANRLVHLIHASELGATREATYRYDGLGRRISKTVRHPNGTTATTYYGWDGDRIVREETENQRTTVVYEPGSFVPMLRIGVSAAKCISDTREWFDQHIKGDSVSSSEDDQVANHHGRNNGAANSTEDCSQICELFRPNGLPSQY